MTNQNQATNGSGVRYSGPYADNQLQQRQQFHWPMTAMTPYMMSGQKQACVEHRQNVPPNVNIYMTSAAPMVQQICQPTEQQQRKWYEEQQQLRDKHEKERNYQLQRQRLHDIQSPMTTATGHGISHQPSMYNVDQLMWNMFRQVDKKPVINRSSPHQVILPNQQHNDLKLQDQFVQKPRNWSELGDLSDIFETSYSGLPAWCQDDALVPPLYTQVEQYVTHNGVIDTSLLYPILLSSGLSRETLGRIWSLANQQKLGQLLKSELYAILALVALAQKACEISSLRILYSLKQAPVPLLNQTTEVLGQNADSAMPPMQVSMTPLPTNQYQPELDNDDFNHFKSADVGFLSDNVPTGKAVHVNVGTRLANHNKAHLTGTNDCDVKDPEEEHKDFSDFSDFQKASVTVKDASVISSSEEKAAIQLHTSNNPTCSFTSNGSQSMWNTMSERSSSPVISRDKMSDDGDKYSVFRELEQSAEDAEDAEYGDFLSAVAAKTDVSAQSYASASKSITSYSPSKESMDDDDDDFGFSGYIGCKHSENHVGLNPDVNLCIKSMSSTKQDDEYLHVHEGENDDFGEFIGSSDHGLNAGVDSLCDSLSLSSLKIEDQGSISIKSQSVSILDLGSDMSRCGSIPSLDLAITSDDDQPDFRDATPSTGINDILTDLSNEGLSMVSMNASKATLLADRYSLIRNEVTNDSDFGKCEWQRCLDSCYDLLKNARNILRELQGDKIISYEVIESQEGENYLKNIIEVYRICRRIANSIQDLTTGEMASKLCGILQDIETEWQELSSIAFLNTVLPTSESSIFDFSSLVLAPYNQNLKRACGVCLLDVEYQWPSSSDMTSNHSLMYGGRQYHASCANLWVNCVDSLLPALTFTCLNQMIMH